MACLDVVFSPLEILPEADCWLVVDLLRATTTIVAFFELGGRRLLPVVDLDEARSLRDRLPGRWLLMGERQALPPPGFDLGNSPLDLAAFDLGAFDGAVMTTTNGTAALLAAAGRGGALHAACARNARAVAEAVAAHDRIAILCAGLEGRPALDDTACAGLLVERLLALRPRDLSDGARMALALFRSAPFADLVGQSRHGRRLAALGLAADLAYCCERDRSEGRPRLVFEGGRPVLVDGRC
ncbi:2-phosphosulfolactate phosphatase [Aminithiophilus ramosus]|uniref:Probable 2-phosphosulfolactate phosphatase n=1 Tax=Aminithiophilus ramosus TaxID=3029084 RepID=A0A9Q7AEU9_9BACT|nr:2-phosphosulfolactate phosphatase [Aminithiophilus ramosus]QTX31984.1 2-phosphosulfolactate phosphatase [Aminithiophilus ramosus]